MVKEEKQITQTNETNRSHPASSAEKEQFLREACQMHAKQPAQCYGIMYGVFVADSSWCTAGVGARNHNCGNARPGSGKYGDPGINWVASNNWRKYSSLRDGVFDNVALYAQLYEGTSIDYMRRNWAGGSHNWARIVSQYSNLR